TTSGKLSEAQLRRKLRATREYLQSVIEQRGAYVEELRSANEELQSSNLELQSVSEELKTVKQELQSRNDQLEQDKENLRLQTRLHESDMRFRTLADSAPVPIWVNGADAGCEFVNKAYLDFFGKTLAEVQGFGWQPHAHPDDNERYVGSYLTAFNARAPFRCQARFLNATGEYRWLDSIGLPRFSTSGEFLGYVGASPDVTETKQVELNTQFVNQLALAMARLTDVDEIIQLTTSKLGQYLGVARCRVSEKIPALSLVVVNEEWEGWLHGAPSIAGKYSISGFGSPELQRTLEAGETVIVNDVTTDSRTRDFAHNYEPLGVGAFIVVPSRHEKQWETTLTVDQPQARDWRPDEAQLMRDVCVRLRLALNHARTVEELRESEARAKRTLAEQMLAGVAE